MDNKKANPMIYVMSGYNQRAVVAFIRYLEKIGYENYSIIAIGNDDLILKTVYKRHVIYIRQNKQLVMEEFEEIFGSNEREGIFMPSTEALVRFQIEHRDFFKKHNIIIPVVEKKLYETISDKRSFWELCKQNSFKVPKIYSEKENLEFPIMVKPKKYRLSTNEVAAPQKVCSMEQLERLMNKYNRQDFDYQQFITGESYYLLYYIGVNGSVYAFSQKNQYQQPNGKSMIAAEPAHIHEEKISEDYVLLLKKVGFYGLIMIELRKHQNEYYMIEANPRMWGPSQLFVDANIDFFGYLLQDYGARIEIENKRINYDARYFWSGGIKGKLSDCRLSGTMDESELLRLLEPYDIYNREDTLEIYKNEGEKNERLT